jgi:3-oxoacyl-[acyl-carrier protein] reductase
VRPTALVTGGGSGIGRAIVEALDDVAWVASLDVAFPRGDGPEYYHAKVDVTNRRAVKKAMEEITRERGGLDWIVCAAGVVRDRVSWKMTDAEWDDVLGVNLTGAFNVVRAGTEHLRKSARGRIVFIGSVVGTRGRFGQANYAASKAGLVGLARSLAVELARDNVTVNVITPGFIDTPMTRKLPQEVHLRALSGTPLGRVGQPEDVAAAVRFLCSDGAAFITGAVLPVDGGQLLGAIR